MNYPKEPTSQAQVDSTEYECELLGRNDLGSVHLHGPFGDKDSKVRIAYVIGMHPLESKSHRALFEKLTSKTDLRNCYYLYNINVNDDSSETEGRLEGQLLAQEFIRDDIIGKEYNLFFYQITNFIFAPGFDDKSSEYMNLIIDNMDEIVYYAPEFRSSPPYITEPTAEAGIPTLVYECYSSEDFEFTCRLAERLIDVVDDLF